MVQNNLLYPGLDQVLHFILERLAGLAQKVAVHAHDRQIAAGEQAGAGATGQDSGDDQEVTDVDFEEVK